MRCAASLKPESVVSTDWKAAISDGGRDWYESPTMLANCCSSSDADGE